MSTCTQLTSGSMAFLNSSAVPTFCLVALLAYKQTKPKQLQVLILPRKLSILDKACQLILPLVEPLLSIQSDAKTIWESMEKSVGSSSLITSQEYNGVLFAEAKRLPSNGYDMYSSKIVRLVKTSMYTLIKVESSTPILMSRIS